MSENTTDTDDVLSEATTILASNPSTYKIRGKLSGADATAVFGYNDATTGSGRGVLGRSDSAADDAAGVRGEAANSTAGAAGDGVVGIAEGPGGGAGVYASGVRGKATNTGGSNTAGVYGSTDDTAAGTRGVFGEAHNASGGKTYGVVGSSFGSGTGAAGVLGAAVDGSATNYGVDGSTASTGTGAAGVRGTADATSGKTYGVKGKTDSEATGAAGVYGEATGLNGTIYGVYGTTLSSSGYGLYSAADAKVVGEHEVTGTVSANSVSTTGSISAGTTLSGADLDLNGSQSIGEVGATVSLTQDTQLSNNNRVRIPFDQVEVDDRNEYDVGENQFFTTLPGDYHVTLNVQWGTEVFSTINDSFDLYITVGGGSGNEVAQAVGLIGPTGSLSKTIRNLNEETAITFEVSQATGGNATLRGLPAGTYVTIDKIG